MSEVRVEQLSPTVPSSNPPPRSLVATKSLSKHSHHVARQQRPATQTLGDECSTLISCSTSARNFVLRKRMGEVRVEQLSPTVPSGNPPPRSLVANKSLSNPFASRCSTTAARHANIGGQMFYSHSMLDLRTQLRFTEANGRSQSRTVVPNCSVEQPSTAKPRCDRAHFKPFASCCSTTAASHANIGGQMFDSHFMLDLRTQLRFTEANGRSQSRTVVPNCSVGQPSTAKPRCNRVPVNTFAPCCSTIEASHANIGGQMFDSHSMLDLRTQLRFTEANERSQSRTVVPNCSVEQPSTAKPCCNEVPVKTFASCCLTIAPATQTFGDKCSTLISCSTSARKFVLRKRMIEVRVEQLSPTVPSGNPPPRSLVATESLSTHSRHAA
ncbi:hypothetical protein RISK_006030 [Rhodopirellula islandica]|uniref:Uncharacterized protein n=1 Tax=Rhodopirellula islandica TaxID=595434 RepID=A0A0J1B5U0_RHOIS|nr:hypothetical protein RISK_006030 [Rhodopirellula islandica]